MRWLNPVLLAIFAAPFFLRRVEGVAVLGLIFLYWFTVWSVGIQYSRVFLAGGTIPVPVAAVIAGANRDSLSKAQRFAQLGIRLGLWLTASVLLLFHILHAAHYPHTIRALVSEEARTQSNASVLAQYGDLNLPSATELAAISEILSTIPRARVQAIAHSGRVVNILFDYGFFFDVDISKPAQIAGANQLSSSWRQSDCVLINMAVVLSEQQQATVRRDFPEVRFQSLNQQWVLRCR